VESVSNVSSEEDLLQLRNEGKVSEAEYQDLLAAMRKTLLSGDEKLASGIDKTKSKRKLGKRAFVLMLLGIILPLVLYLIAGLALWPKFFLGLVLEIAAFVMGVVAWPDDFGKAAVAGSVAIMVIAILLFVL
jgi:hypothetical protein